MVFSNNILLGASSQVSGGYIIEGSAYPDGSTGYLSRTLGTPSDATTFVVLWEGKRVKLGSRQALISAQNTSGLGQIEFTSSDKLRFVLQNTGGSSVGELITTAVYRDPAAYMQVVATLDGTNGLRLFVDGYEVTAYDTETQPSLPYTSVTLNTARSHEIFRQIGGTNYFNSYTDRVALFDGLTITDPQTDGFGQLTSDGYWEVLDVSALTIKAKSEVDENADVSAYIGDMTATGGLTAIDDGSTTWSSGYASKNGAGGSAYVGWDWGSGNSKTITGFVIQTGTTGATLNWSLNTGSSSCTIRFYGSNSAPSNATDGTMLKEFANTPNTSGTYYSLSAMSGLSATAYRYHWFTILCADNELGIGEAQLFVDGADQWGQNGFLLEGGTNVANGRNNLATTTDLVEGTTGWTGATGNWTVTRDLVTVDTNNRSMYWNTALAGDFDFEVMIVSEASGDGLVLGVIASANIGSFSSTSANGGCFSGNFGQYINCNSDDYREGNSGATSFTGVGPGDRVGIRRVGTTVSITINGSVDTNFSSSLSGDCYVFIGSGNSAYESKNMLLNDGGTVTALGDWLVNGTITATNDSPTDDADNGYGNHATLNPLVGGILSRTLTTAFSNGNRTFTVTGNGTNGQNDLIPLTILADDVDCYFEVVPAANSGSTRGGQAGFVTTKHLGTQQTGGASTDNTLSISNGSTFNNSAGITVNTGSGAIQVLKGSASFVSTGISYASNDRLLVFYDASERKVYGGYYDDSAGTTTWYDDTGAGTADPDAGTGELFTLTDDGGQIVAAVHSGIGAVSGATNTIVYTEPDDWVATPPTAAKALATQNITPPSVNPSEHAEVLLYEGTGAAQDITGQDWGGDDELLVLKNRDQADSWKWMDTIRGAGQSIQSNNADAETDESASQTAFNDDGFSLAGTDGSFNTNNESYMALRLRAGTSGSNSDGSITSTVSANTTSGFSIVSYTGNNTGSATVGHGLGVTPKLIIIKNRDATEAWRTYHVDVASGSALDLNSTSAAFSTANRVSAVSSTTFTLSSNGAVINGTDDYIAYCFADVADLATSCFRIGSRTGNGSADGPMMTNDASSLLCIDKRTDSADNWRMFNTVVSTYNPVNARLEVNGTNAEATSGTWFDFVSNGRKTRGTDTGINASGGTYIYLDIINQFLAGGADAWTQGRAR